MRRSESWEAWKVSRNSEAREFLWHLRRVMGFKQNIGNHAAKAQFPRVFWTRQIFKPLSPHSEHDGSKAYVRQTPDKYYYRLGSVAPKPSILWYGVNVNELSLQVCYYRWCDSYPSHLTGLKNSRDSQGHVVGTVFNLGTSHQLTFFATDLWQLLCADDTVLWGPFPRGSVGD